MDRAEGKARGMGAERAQRVERPFDIWLVCGLCDEDGGGDRARGVGGRRVGHGGPSHFQWYAVMNSPTRSGSYSLHSYRGPKRDDRWGRTAG